MRTTDENVPRETSVIPSENVADGGVFEIEPPAGDPIPQPTVPEASEGETPTEPTPVAIPPEVLEATFIIVGERLAVATKIDALRFSPNDAKQLSTVWAPVLSKVLGQASTTLAAKNPEMFTALAVTGIILLPKVAVIAMAAKKTKERTAAPVELPPPATAKVRDLDDVGQD